jgi:uncharacterized Zn finger protein
MARLPDTAAERETVLLWCARCCGAAIPHEVIPSPLASGARFRCLRCGTVCTSARPGPHTLWHRGGGDAA